MYKNILNLKIQQTKTIQLAVLNLRQVKCLIGDTLKLDYNFYSIDSKLHHYNPIIRRYYTDEYVSA